MIHARFFQWDGGRTKHGLKPGYLTVGLFIIGENATRRIKTDIRRSIGNSCCIRHSIVVVNSYYISKIVVSVLCIVVKLTSVSSC